MFKFIHLTDTHVIGGDDLLFGANPRRRLELAVESIATDHADAAFVVITGDLTHWGDQAAYKAFYDRINALPMPYYLMMGNHDDMGIMNLAFTQMEFDENGYLQQKLETPVGPFILTDTKAPKGHHGEYCEKRLDWLNKTLSGLKQPGLLFMHHPPFDVGITSLDRIRNRDGEKLLPVLERHRDKIRHMLFGHVHRVISGNWHGFSFSFMRGLNHQSRLDLDGDDRIIRGDLTEPAYGVVLVDEHQIIAHVHNFTNTSPQFDLHDLVGGDNRSHALTMRHEDWQDVD